MTLAPRCRICRSATRPLGRQLVLGRHDVGYHQCMECGFAQTDDPWWLGEAYCDAITATDLGLLARCKSMSRRIPGILACGPALREPVLDWGGGYGTLTRMLRDAGIDCRHFDPHCPNIHARGFEATLDCRPRWGAVIAIEVLEHLVDPWSFLRPAAERTDLIIASTCPVHVPARPLGRWWYWAPEHGQHVAFYSRPSLRRIATALGMAYVPAAGLHVFARGASLGSRLAMRVGPVRWAALACRRPEGLLARDHELAVRRARDPSSSASHG